MSGNYNKGKFENINSILGHVFTKSKVIIYVISFLMSMIEFGNGITPFSMAIFAAACSNFIPAIFIYAITMLGTAIKFGASGALSYLLISLLFIAMILIFKPWYEEEYKSERRKLGRYALFATLIVKVIETFFQGFLIYSFLLSIVTSIATYVFYKIFANSLIVLNEWEDKKAFAIEEIIGACLMISIALLALGNITLFGLNVGQVLMIIMILVLGWKNGIMVGATAGITIGTVVGIIGNNDPIIIAAFALSGMLAGVLNRFGKIGVVIGFMLGNAILTYIYNGNTIAIIYFKEILVASLGLILVPKKLEINITDLFDKTVALEEGAVYRLEESKETISKLNNVSKAIHAMSETYKIENKKKPKDIFLNELSVRLDRMDSNILYEDLYNYNNGIAEDAYKLLRKKNKITNYDLETIFQNHNAYISLINEDSFNKDIDDVLEAINESYKISNVTYLWNQKINENKENISNQLNNVSEVISNIAKDIESDDNKFNKEILKIKTLAERKDIIISDIKIKKIDEKYIVNIYTDKCECECNVDDVQNILSEVLQNKIVLEKKECAIENESNVCRQIYISKDKYILKVGIAKKIKDKSIASGDSYIKTKLEDGKVLIALSDGMGSGPEARKTSKVAIKMLERLLKVGFQRESSIKMINSSMCLNEKDDMYATLDIAILDLFSGNIEMMKNGACPTYIKGNNGVQLVKSLSLPAGIINNIDLITYEKDFEDGEIIVMCTDGIIESSKNEEKKELWVKDLLEKINTDDVKKIADLIIQESVDNNVGKVKDDMTVMVAKVEKIKNI